MTSLIQLCHNKGECDNKPYPLEIMLRLCLLKNRCDLSNDVTVAEVISICAFPNFCGIC